MTISHDFVLENKISDYTQKLTAQNSENLHMKK